MSGDQGSGFEWRRKRGRVNKALERVEDVPWNLLSRRGLLTDSAKRKLYETGIQGRAEILEAPGEHAISEVGENIGRFQVRVDLPGRDPYRVKVTQSFEGGYESEGLTQGALVECRVDPKNEKRVLLLAPEPDERRLSVVDSSRILAEGRRARATVSDSKNLQMTAPGTDDPVYLLRMQLRSDDEPGPWEVEIGQRVPFGAEELVEKGKHLTVAYLEVDNGDSVAVDWRACSGRLLGQATAGWEVQDIRATVAELEARGVVFEEVDVPGLRTVDGIAEISGNDPSMGARGERGAWFRDSEGNMLGIGEAVR